MSSPAPAALHGAEVRVIYAMLIAIPFRLAFYAWFEIMKDGWLGLRQVFILCFPSGATCYDNAAENCGGNVIPGVSTRDCCLGDGFWVNQTNGECVQCIGKYCILGTELLSSFAYKPSTIGAITNPLLSNCHSLSLVSKSPVLNSCQL